MAREPVDIETLLQHRPFVRALARSLVRDDARADDVVQETYAAALRNPPLHAGALRAWLAAVVRKLAWTHLRSERRRTRREGLTEPRPAPPAPDEALQRAQWHQRLVNLVMELPEPYRSTVVLRYFEDLNSSEIAELHGVPAATVRTRLRRGIARLKQRLDADTPGGRAKWLGALLVLAWPDEVAVAAGGAGAAQGAALPKWPLLAAGGGLLAVFALLLVALAGRGGVREHAHAPALRTAPDVAPARAVPELRVHSGQWGEPDAGGSPLDVTVLAGGRPAPAAQVMVTRLEPHPWRYTVYDPWRVWARRRADRSGRASFEGAPNGYVRILASAPGRGRGETVAYLPLEISHRVVVELPPEADLPVRVVDGRTGRPVPGARVALAEAGAPWLLAARTAPTGAEGSTAVRGLPPERPFVLRVARDGYAAWTRRFVAAPDGPVTVELAPRDRTRSWSIVPGPAPAPPAGTLLGLRRLHAPRPDRTARIEGLAVVADGFGDGVVPELLAVATDGAFAVLGETAAFARPVQLEVQVRDPAGAPVPDVDVRFFDPASNSPLYPDARTGHDGRALLPVYAADPVAVRVRERAHEPFRTVRRFDPVGDARIQVRVPAARVVELDVRPELPVPFELYTGRTRLARDEIERQGSRLRFRLREGEPVHLLAAGHLPATIEPAGPRADVELAPSGTLVLHVAAAPGQPFRLALIDAHDESPRRGPWRFRLYPGPDRVVRETMLPPGLFRVRDVTSGLTTEEFRVLPGHGTVTMRLDLTGAWPPREPEVRGVVVGLGDVDLARAEVVAGAGTVPVSADGTFRLPWSGDGPVEVHARHPDAAASPAPVTVTGPRDDLVLRLAPRHRARVRLVPAPAPAPGQTAPRVLVDGRVFGATVEDGLLRFAGYRPAAATLWIDVPGFAPERKDEVALGEGETDDLGTIDLRRGTTLRFRILGRDGEPVPALTFTAQALDAPRYRRSSATDGGEHADLAGLGPGTFRVSAWERYSGLPVWSRTVTVDGTNDAEHEIDLR